MKKIIFLHLLLWWGVTALPNANAQTHLPNPERGFRFEEIVKIPSLQDPWGGTWKLNSATWLKPLQTEFNATDKDIRLSQLYFYFTDFAGTDTLPQAALDSVNSVLNGVRKQGFKVVLRLTYTYDGTGGYVYPPMARILKHLDQLTPILRNNIDVIHVLQAGIIGLWGEWHNYNNAYNQTDKTNLLKKLLTILPQGRHTQVRFPVYKNDANLSAEEDARVGFNNDFFTDEQHVQAYNWGFLSGPNYNQVAEESKSLQVDGEMPWTGPQNNDFLNVPLDPFKSIQQFKDHHYTSFSITHNYYQAIANWKTVSLTKAQMDANGFPYDPAYFSSGSRTVYDYVADHLGYRLWADYGASSVVEDDSLIHCSVAIRNYGFSAIHNPREVFMVLMRENGTLADTVKLTNKPSDWHTDVTQTLSTSFRKVSGLGNYKIGIWMPDFQGSPSRRDARYAMRFANLDWSPYGVGGVDSLGINLLKRDSLKVISYCAAPGDMSPGDRFIKSLSTSNALRNISFSNSSFPAGGYMKYGARKIGVSKGSSFTVTMANSPNTKWSRVAVWIDWNKDGDFSDAGEMVMEKGAATTDNSATVLNFTESITVPANAATGTVGMRVRLYDAWFSNPGPCNYADNSGNFDFFLDIVPAASPQYCSAPGDSKHPADRYIQTLSTSGAIQNISYSASSFPAGGYTKFSSQRAIVGKGSSFTVNMNNSPNTKWNRILVWVDWNRDGTFDDTTERVLHIGNADMDNSATVLSLSQSISVPSTASTGVTGMRIRFYDAWFTIPGPCGYQDNGSIFDFSLDILPQASPQYCSAPGDSIHPADRYIQTLSTSGAVQNINYSASGFPAGGYTKFSAQRAIVEKGSSFAVNMNNSPNTKWNRILVWVDWNRDGTFDNTTERVLHIGNADMDNSATVLSLSQSISVPSTASTGVTGMRIRFYDAWFTIPGPCGYQDNGSIFDFSLDIVPQTSPQYCSAPGDSIQPADRYIQTLSTSGAIQNISYSASSFPAGGYTKFSSQRAIVEKGSSFTVNMNNSPNTKWSRILVWVDWNRDGTFDNTTERVLHIGNANMDNSSTVLSLSQSISVPSTASKGITGMRIRFYDAWFTIPGPCGYQDNGSIFDFQVETTEAGGGSSPARLAAFNATIENQSTVLSWSTNWETNTDRFEIQQSQDKKNWETIGTRNSQGESKSLSTYNFIDHSPFPGINYYRLKMIDADGAYAFSQIRKVNTKELPGLMVFPNPATEVIFLENAGIPVSKYKLLDVNGRTVMEGKYQPATGVDLAKLSPGVYVISVTDAENSVQTQKIVINK